MTNLLSRTTVLESDDLSTIDVEVPEWGGTIRLRTMTGKQRDEIETMISAGAKNPAKTQGIKASLLIRCAIGEDGSPMFTANDLQALQKKSATVLDRLFSAALNHNAIGGEEVEAIAGNSEEGQNGDSG